MHSFRRTQLVLLAVIVVGMTGFMYRWHNLHSSSRWLPPTMYDQDDDIELVEKRRLIDEKYCGGPCRFILPVFILEQESKAQMHFRQLAFMAGLVNRTIVLPNVGGSRLGACLDHDFEFYYSRQWAIDNQEHFNHITMSDFRQWLEERHAIDRPGTSQSMHIHVNLRGHAAEPTNCFADHLLNMNGLPERRLYLNETGNAGRRVYYQDAVKDFFLGIYRDHASGEIVKDNITDNMEVLSVFYDRRFPFVHNPAADAAIPYSEQIRAQADQIASQLQPYWAVHWRTERVEPATNLVACARTLVEYIHKVQESRRRRLDDAREDDDSDDDAPPIADDRARQQEQPTLFLLTDYPHVFDESGVQRVIDEDGTDESKKHLKLIPASASFSSRNLTISHHAAMQYVYQHLQVKVTHLGDPPTDIHLPANWSVIPVANDVAHQDPGWLGILDKLLAMRATGFLAGAPGVCGRKSSFTNQIMNERLEHPGINVIDYFDLPPDIAEQQEQERQAAASAAATRRR
ncbi:hypothetical protein BC940DRAFT_310592 [Gongronella butleri]|nr:hypothetical protein BC940DRAFT_310592 [Gongronella butleri]